MKKIIKTPAGNCSRTMAQFLTMVIVIFSMVALVNCMAKDGKNDYFSSAGISDGGGIEKGDGGTKQPEIIPEPGEMPSIKWSTMETKYLVEAGDYRLEIDRRNGGLALVTPRYRVAEADSKSKYSSTSLFYRVRKTVKGKLQEHNYNVGQVGSIDNYQQGVVVTFKSPEKEVDREVKLFVRIGEFNQLLLELKVFPHKDVFAVGLAFARGKGSNDKDSFRVEEQFYGLGEQFDHFNNTGKYRQLQRDLHEKMESGHNEVHFIVPFLLSSRNYGLLVDTYQAMDFDLGQDNDPNFGFLVYTNQFKFHLFSATNPAEVYKSYLKITGNPHLPPKWVFAPQHWRNKVSSYRIVLDDAAKMRQYKIPGSLIGIDSPWETCYNSMEFNKLQFLDPRKMIDELHRLGFKVALWMTEYINFTDDSDEMAGMNYCGDLYEHAETAGYFVTDHLNEPLPLSWRKGIGSIIDFTNPHATDWYRAKIKNLLQMGIDGFKLDGGEGVIPYGTGSLPLKYLFKFKSGETNREMHSKYSLLYHKAFYDQIMETKKGDGFIIARAGALREQKYHMTSRSGDLDNDFSFFGDLITKEGGGKGKLKVGGLPSAINAGLSLAISGFPYYGSDIGGFRNGSPAKEVLIRWSQFGVFSPIMQLGGGGESHNPWDFNLYDQQTLDIYRQLAQMRMQFIPYIYTIAEQASSGGLPVMRPLFFHFPQSQPAYTARFQYMFGDSLLVAPIYKAGGKRDIFFPPGRWIDFFTDAVVQGPTEEKNRWWPLERMPLYVRAGALLPMLPPGVDTLVAAEKASVKDMDKVKGELHLLAYPSGQSDFTMYDGTFFKMDEKKEMGITLEIESNEDRNYTIKFKMKASSFSPWFNCKYSVKINGQEASRVEEEKNLSKCLDCVFCQSKDKTYQVRSRGKKIKVEMVP